MPVALIFTDVKNFICTYIVFPLDFKGDRENPKTDFPGSLYLASERLLCVEWREGGREIIRLLFGV